ncbi:hypothetical protein KI387_038219, partial [Taxus chinensis]
MKVKGDEHPFKFGSCSFQILLSVRNGQDRRPVQTGGSVTAALAERRFCDRRPTQGG